MDERRPAWSTRLSEEWHHLGLEVLRVLGIEETNYQNEKVKDRLLQSVALCYWDALTRYARAEKGLTVEDIGKRLGVHRATVNRWMAEEHLSHPDKFFGAIVVVLREEMQQIG